MQTTTNVAIVGGASGLAHAVGMDPAPDPPRFVAELTRVIYDAPEGESAATAEKLHRLNAHLELVRKFQTALAAAQPADGTIRLDMAREKNERNRLQTFLGLVGLKLRERKSAFTVEQTDNKDAAERVRLLAETGIDLKQLAAKLNAGEAVHVAVPVEQVPVALSARTWGEHIFDHRVTDQDLFAAIVSDRNAALLARGLAGMDDATLAFVSEHPKLLRRLYAHDAPAVAAFGDSLHVRDGHLVLPGGEPATELWRAVVDERVDRVEDFISELFGKADGRIAYLFDTVAHLTPPQQGFALGFGIANPAARIERFKALADIASSAYVSWNLNERPFKRVSRDLAMWLSRMDVDGSGTPRAPAARVFWKRAFESDDLPEESAKLLRKGSEDADFDAAWLAEQLTVKNVAERKRRFEQFMFGQRVFAGADEGELPDSLVALRGYARFPMLLLTLDRAGVRTPAVFAAAARHADRLSTLDPSHAFVALSQFQGAIAIVERLATVGRVSVTKTEELVTALSSARLDGDRYGGAVAEWIATVLAPALASSQNLTDRDLMEALAGSPPSSGSPSVTWEGQSYRLDLAAPELRRLSRMRAKLATVSLDTVMELAAARRALLSSNPSVSIAQAEAARLQKISATLDPAARSAAPPGVDAAKAPREILTKISQDLAKIKKTQDAKKAQKSGESLGEVVDVLLAQSLRSLVYAMSVGGGEGSTLTSDIGERHDFGFTMVPSEDARRKPWMMPEPQVESGTPWHVRGSLLGLDVALGTMSLTRIASDAPARPPVLTDAARHSFIASYVLMDAWSLRDQDRDAIVAAIERGRARIAAAALGDAASGLDDIAEVLDLDGWRQRAVRWMWDQHKDASGVFSLSELLALGRPPSDTLLDGWGPGGFDLDSCLCTRAVLRPQWEFGSGRREVALEAAQVADLQLRVAIALRDLKLPARLARGVMSAALSDYLDEVHPADADDWLTLVRTAQAVTLDRIQDYVAALTAAGPLVPESGKDTRH